MSTAAVRLAFCHHEASRRWLAEQESRLLSSRIRLGETSLADVERATAEMDRHDANDDDDGDDGSYSRALFGTPPPPEANHRWIPFERAAPLLRRRDVRLCRGWASVPEARMRDVLIATYADKLVKELETTRRRLAHVHTAAVGSSAGFGSPGVGACLLELARWRPARDEYEFLGRDDEDDRRVPSSSARAGAGDVARGRIGGGGADRGADGVADWGADGAAFNFEGDASGGRGQWRRGWRRKKSKDRRSRGGSDPVIASSLPAGLHVQPTRVDGPYGRLPAGPWTVELGPDAKRVLRVLRRGVKGVAARPYPPCMRRHLQTLHRERHLKHHSRWQLTLFLKGADMSVDEALAVWRSQFSHGKMADFQREHTYAVRHSFGLEGKMADYPPHTCERLGKNSARGDGEPGCPFAGCAGAGGGRNDRIDALRRELGVLVDPSAADEIAAVAAAGAPRAACRALFDHAHGMSPGTGPLRDLRFPHDWYHASVDLEDEAREAAGAPKDGGGGGGGGGERGGEGEGAAGSPPRRMRRRHVELELESSSDEDEDEDGDSRELRELREVLGNA